MTHLTLYTTLGCHLCERLEALLASLHEGQYRLEKVEISEDEALMQRFGVRIPVLVDDAGAELDLGFEPQRLANWLAERGRLDEAAWRRLQPGEGESGRGGHDTAGAPARSGGRRYLS
ncbi:glutaredoxin family protein [Billgrantia ethanolica]|uniref:Glutaredoxin family protein n=1 Tax=Billgrantia ethanolica TaxID=2733486 RepID=A0ABS8ZXC3_9GAMM|nr:glutaredoxin family protein [Halomonas ethanolica]MCE8001348.1 glutaredoxin family protein [Halomonas ethanolica]